MHATIGSMQLQNMCQSDYATRWTPDDFPGDHHGKTTNEVIAWNPVLPLRLSIIGKQAVTWGRKSHHANVAVSPKFLAMLENASCKSSMSLSRASFNCHGHRHFDQWNPTSHSRTHRLTAVRVSQESCHFLICPKVKNQRAMMLQEWFGGHSEQDASQMDAWCIHGSLHLGAISRRNGVLLTGSIMSQSLTEALLDEKCSLGCSYTGKYGIHE